MTRLILESVVFGLIPAVAIYVAMYFDETYTITRMSVMQCVISGVFIGSFVFIMSYLDRQNARLQNDVLSKEEKQKIQTQIAVRVLLLTVSVAGFAIGGTFYIFFSALY